MLTPRMVLMLLFVCGCTVTVKASSFGKYVSVSANKYVTEDVSQHSLEADGAIEDLSLFAILSSTTFGSRKAFVALEANIMRRQLSYGATAGVGEQRMFQRYGFFAGVTLFNINGQKGTFMIDPGVAAGSVGLDERIGYLHLIYDHHFITSHKLTIGLGAVVQYNFDAWRQPINFLPTVKWKIAPGTALRVAWDNLQFRQKLFKKVTAVGETRYDLSFFRLPKQLSCELETVSIGGGFDVRLGQYYTLRLRLLELVSHREIIRKNGSVVVDIDGGRGRMIKLAIVSAR